MGACGSKKKDAAQVQEPVLLGSETTAPEPEKEPAGDTAPPPAEETGDAAPPTAEAPVAEPAGETGPPAAVETPVGAEEPVAVAEFLLEASAVEAAHEEPKENDAAEPAREPASEAAALETKTVPSTWSLLTCCGCTKVAEEIPVLKIVKDQKSPAPDEATVAGAAAKEDVEVSLETAATEPIAFVQAGAVVEQEAAASTAEPSAEPSAPPQAETAEEKEASAATPAAPSQAQASVEEEAEAPRKERAAPLEGGLGLENDDVEPSVSAAAVEKEVAAPAAPTPTEVAASATPATQ